MMPLVVYCTISSKFHTYHQIFAHKQPMDTHMHSHADSLPLHVPKAHTRQLLRKKNWAKLIKKANQFE